MRPTQYLIVLTLAAFFSFSSCKQENSATKEKELELKEKELALKEKELELQKNAGNATSTTSTTAGTTSIPQNTTTTSSKATSSFGTASIIGEGVIMRQLNSTESAKLANFNKGERVNILEQSKPQNQNQAIAAKAIKLYDDYNGKYMFTLNKGKALLIEEFTGTAYKVSYQHEKMGKLFATVTPTDLESISNETWYKVKRENGQEGWVLGKYVQK